LGNNTLEQYDSAVAACKDLFLKKAADYGSSWRVMRPSSITDQMFIKAQRIQTLDQVTESKVGEGIQPEFMALANYGIIGLILLMENPDVEKEIPLEKVEEYYDKHARSIRELMEAKNHDYGEAWRDMRISSMTDFIMVKILRMKQIEDNEGETIVSEGLDGNLKDIVNYAVFALIKLKEGS